jgi:hypothetical protein
MGEQFAVLETVRVGCLYPTELLREIGFITLLYFICDQVVSARDEKIEYLM